MKKIVSFSIYGDLECYMAGAIKNTEMKNDFYKDWIYRFYVEEGIPDRYIGKLIDLGCEVHIMSKSDGHSGMFWRFRPLDDNDIDAFIVRDTDARPSDREVLAVEEWMKSECNFHIIRDNKHHGVPILGGLWGAKSSFRPNFDEMLEEWLSENQILIENSVSGNRGKFFGLDQKFLRDKIWPKIKETHMAHIIDYQNLKFTGREIIMKEDKNFIGRSFMKNLNKKYE